MKKSDAKRVLDRHFKLMELIKAHYKRREEKPGQLALAIEHCKEQIQLAPMAAEAFVLEDDHYRRRGLPAHTGYEQLAIIFEKQGRLREAVDLCVEAKRNGWGAGCTKGPVNWDNRIERCTKKLNNTSAMPKRIEPVEPAAISVPCPGCGRELNVPAKYAGTRGSCKHCGGPIEVPG